MFQFLGKVDRTPIASLLKDWTKHVPSYTVRAFVHYGTLCKGHAIRCNKLSGGGTSVFHTSVENTSRVPNFHIHTFVGTKHDHRGYFGAQNESSLPPPALSVRFWIIWFLVPHLEWHCQSHRVRTPPGNCSGAISPSDFMGSDCRLLLLLPPRTMLCWRWEGTLTTENYTNFVLFLGSDCMGAVWLGVGGALWSIDPGDGASKDSIRGNLHGSLWTVFSLSQAHLALELKRAPCSCPTVVGCRQFFKSVELKIKSKLNLSWNVPCLDLCLHAEINFTHSRESSPPQTASCLMKRNNKSLVLSLHWSCRQEDGAVLEEDQAHFVYSLAGG